MGLYSRDWYKTAVPRERIERQMLPAADVQRFTDRPPEFDYR